MQCYIYRSSLKEGLYIYLADKDGLQTLPPAIMKQLGQPEFAMELDLQPTTRLQQENAANVIENLSKQGFHLQSPRDIEDQLATISRQATLKRQR